MAFDGDVIGEGDDRIFVGPGAPDFAVRNFFAPQRSAANQRTAVIDRYVRQADSLRIDGPLAERREFQFRRLAPIFELRRRAASKATES